MPSTSLDVIGRRAHLLLTFWICDNFLTISPSSRDPTCAVLPALDASLRDVEEEKVKAKILILVQVVLLVSLMGGYATTIHGVGRMGEERPEGQVPSLDAEDAAEFRVSIGDHSVGGPIMAFNPQASEYLVVWSDERSGNRQVWGSLVDAYGDPIGTDFLISGESHSAGPYPTVAWGEDRWGNPRVFGYTRSLRGCARNNP